jgi:transcriptional regulator with XRE-family HTH domain
MLHMSPTDRIHQGKAPHRKHFIPEWAEARGLKQKDIVKSIGADKSTVARWFNGQTPRDEWLRPLAALFQTDINGLFRDPDDDWLKRLFADRDAAEKAKIKQALENLVDMMPRKRA